MTPIIIIQARLNSTRFPHKVLKEVMGRPLLYYTLTRLKGLKIPYIPILATTTNEEDQALIDFGNKMNIQTFRGSEANVLERFYQIAKKNISQVYVRITGDCPLVDPNLLDQMLSFFISKMPFYDYVSNTLERSYPKGLDIEIFTFETLEKAFFESETAYQKEHVTPYIYQNKNLFSLYNFKDREDFSNINISVDTFEDFQRVKKILELYYPQNPYFDLEKIKEHFKNGA